MPKPLAVLNIEDSESDSGLIFRLLKKAGYKVTFERIETAEQMRSALKKRAWDIIISDHSLPQFDSYAALVLLREEGLDIPFITVSGTIGEESAAAVIKAGAHDFLAKDNLTRLIPTVDRELEQAKIRNERKQLEVMYRILAENSIQGVAIFQGNKMVYANPALSRINGYTNKELMAMSAEQIFSITHPDDRAISQERINQRAAGKPVSPDFEIRIIRKDGATRWVQAFTDQIEFEGQPAILSTLIDITERKRAEDELQASERHFRALIENGLDDISLVTADGTLMWESPSVVRNLNYAPNEFLGRNIFELMHPDDLEQTQNLYSQLIQKPGSRQTGTFRLKRSNGRWRWVEAIATNMLHEPSVQAIVINYRDITERKQAEDALRQSEQKYRSLYALSERREQERALLDSVRTALAHELDLTTILRTVVEAITKTFGYTLVSLYLLRDETLVLQHQTGYSNVINEIPITQGIAGRVARSGEPLLIEDVRADQAFLGAVDNIVSEVCVPLFYQDQIIGILSVESTQNTKLTEADLNLMVALSEHISPVIGRARLYTAIGENEKRFRALIENSADAITLLDAQGLVTYDSPAAPGMLGYAPDERIRQSMFELIHADDLQEAQELFQKVMEKTGTRMHGIFRLRHKNNTWHWIEAVVTNLLDEAGVQAIVINYRDITKRRQAEDTLRENEERYRIVGRATNDAIWDWNLTTNATLWNEGYQALFGYPPQETDPSIDSWIKPLHAEDADRVIHGIHEVIERGAHEWSDEYRFRRRDGTYAEIFDRGYIIHDAQGKPVRMIGAMQDITERKQIEAALVESERAHRTLFENVPVGLYRTSVDGHMLDANPTLVKMFGYQDQESLLAMKVKDLYADPADMKKFNDGLDRRDIITSMEVELRKKDGATFWVEDHVKVLRDEAGNPLFYEGSLIDVTERKRSEEALRESDERFRSLFNRMMDGVYRSKHEGKFVEVNPAMIKMFGYDSKEEMLAVDIKNELYFEPEERGSHVLDTGQEEMDVYRMRRKDGSEIWVEDHGSYIHDEQGNIIFHEGILRDITDRKRAEDALAESEARFRQAIAAADAIPYSLNYASDHYTYMGEEITKLAGYSLEEMTPAFLDTLILETIMHGVFEGMRLDEAVRLVREGNSGILWNCDHRIRTRSGEERWISDSSIQVLDKTGIPKGSIGIIQDITERKHTETLAREGEARYRSLFDDSPVSLWEEDFSAVKIKLDALRDEGVRDFRAYFASNPQLVLDWISFVKITDVNKATMKLFGAKERAELQQNLPSFIDNDSTQLFQNELISLAQGGSHFEGEGVRQTLDGRQIIVKLSLSVIPGYEDTFSKVIISMVDITARIQAEKAIRESEKHLRESQEIAGLGSYVLDFKKDIWKGSEIFDRLLGIDQTYERTMASWPLLIHSDDRQSINDHFEKEVIGKHIRIDREFRIIRVNDHAERWVHAVGEVEFDSDGQPIKIHGTLQDITERKTVEESLRHSENRYLLASKATNDVIWEWNLETDQLFWNENVQVIFGYLPDEIDLHETWWQNHIHPKDQKRISQETKDRISRGDSIWTDEYRFQRKDGSYAYIVDRGYVERDDNGKALRMIGAMSDVTKRKQVEEALRESEHRYRALFEDMPIAIWEEDFSDLKKHLESLTEQGITDLREYFRSNPEATIECDAMINILDVNRAALKMYGAESKLALLESLDEGLSAGEREHLVDDLIAISEGKTSHSWEGGDETLAGEPIEISLSWSVAPGHEVDFSKVIVTTVDITERKRAEAERQVLLEITQGMSMTGSLQELLELIRHSLNKVIYAENFFVVFHNRSSGLFEEVFAVDKYDPTMPPSKLERSITSYVFRTGESLLLTQATFDELAERGEVELVGTNSPSWLGAPLKTPSETIGVIVVQNYEDADCYSERDREFLASVAVQVSLAIERKRAEDNLSQRVAELELLYESGLAMSQLLNPKDIAQKIIDLLEQKMHWHHTAIRLYHPEDETLVLLAFHQPDLKSDMERRAVESRFKTMVSHSSQGLSGWAVQHGKTVRVGNLTNDDRYAETFPGLHSGLYVPIKTGERIVGVISIESEIENAFNKSDEQLTTILATQAASIFENARLYEEITQRASELEQRVAERTAQIETTKRRLELATHAGQIGVWEYIPRENKVIWDERMHMIHQVPSGEFDGTSQTWAQLIHPDDIEQSQINRELAVTKNLLMNNEHRVIWPDGSVRHIMTSAVTAYSAEGTPERIIGINMDITERKEIEKSLRESENYARLLFDAAPDPVSVTEADGSIVDVNEVFEKQYNLVRSEIRGKRISELGIYPESELDKREKYLWETLQGQEVKPVELDYYVAGDRIHTLELHSYLLKVNGRQLVLNTAHDITSHKKAEDAERLAKSEIEHALRIKNEFLANMSHELRTPLNAILGISESLEEQIAGALNEKQLKYIGIVRESGRHLLDLINDILDLSKIEAGRMELDVHRISVDMLCQSSLRMIKELSQKKNLHVSFKVKGDINVIRADQRRLKQSLVNLLSNAVKFTASGNEIGLEVSGNTETNEVEFTVWDQGVGIAEEDIKLLFKPFVQLDAGLAREYQGTGLGLALVAQMINLHGGHVSVKSESGKGSRFTITLPWSPNEQTPKANVTGELTLPDPRPDEKRNGRILLVEDTDVVVQLISEYLHYKGYEVILAHNGVEAIKLAAQEHPDLILMDVMMPIMDGLEATQKIRIDQTLQDTPIIALTALAMSGDSERCLAAGMNDYLSKPIQMQNLADMIEKYLGPTEEESNEQ